MSTALDPFIFFQVSSSRTEDAFAFHESSKDEHIWPRSESEIQKFCVDGELFAVRHGSSGEIVGLCYVHLEGAEFEFGGLTVSETIRGLHLGSVLTNFAIAHTIANQRPWTYGQELIAHVHEANQMPRNVLKRAGFEHTGTVTIPAGDAPASMKRNARGEIVGDKFLFPREKVRDLSKWFDAFEGTVTEGKAQAVFEIPPGGLEKLREALHEAVDEIEKK